MALSATVDATYQGRVEYTNVNAKVYVDWNTDTRTQTVGTSASTFTSNALISNAIMAYNFTAKGAYYDGVGRAFAFFDVSSVTSGGTITACTLRVLGYLNNSGRVIPVKSTAWGTNGSTSTLSTSDLGNVDFSTTYATALASWDTSAWNNFTLNATALSDMNSNGYFNVALLNSSYDQPNSTLTPPVEQYNGVEFLDATNPLRLSITYLNTSGYGNIVNGVAAANIGAVNGVLTADIDTVNGV